MYLPTYLPHWCRLPTYLMFCYFWRPTIKQSVKNNWISESLTWLTSNCLISITYLLTYLLTYLGIGRRCAPTITENNDTFIQERETHTQSEIGRHVLMLHLATNKFVLTFWSESPRHVQYLVSFGVYINQSCVCLSSSVIWFGKILRVLLNLAKCSTYFSFLQMAKYWKIIQPSGHTV